MAGCPPLRSDRRLPGAQRVRPGLLTLLAALALGAAGCGGDDDPVEGAGYSYSVPDGWQDVSDDADDEIDIGGLRPDSLVVGEREEGFAPDVNVIREGGLPAGITTAQYADVSLAGLKDPERAGLPPELVDIVGKLEPHDFSETRDTELDGEEAVVWDFSGKSRDGDDTRVRQVTAVRGRSAYTVTLTVRPDRFEDETDALDEVVESWEWED
jgi:hypothetical protein